MITTSVAIALAIVGSVSTPEQVAAKQAAAVCQFYPGDPLCKTVEVSSCAGVGLGVEGQVCRRTTEYWYWS